MEITVINPRATLLVSGAIDDWEAVRRRGVNAIVDLDGDVDAGLPEGPGAVLYVYFPIADEELPDLRKLEALARLVAQLVEEGQVVLVHCLLGANRSNLLAAAALTYLGMTGAQALDHVREVRPGALFNPYFADYLQTLPARRIRIEASWPSAEAKR